MSRSEIKRWALGFGVMIAFAVLEIVLITAAEGRGVRPTGFRFPLQYIVFIGIYIGTIIGLGGGKRKKAKADRAGILIKVAGQGLTYIPMEERKGK
jgi:hypothetical protein